MRPTRRCGLQRVLPICRSSTCRVTCRNEHSTRLLYDSGAATRRSRSCIHAFLTRRLDYCNCTVRQVVSTYRWSARIRMTYWLIKSHSFAEMTALVWQWTSEHLGRKQLRIPLRLKLASWITIPDNGTDNATVTVCDCESVCVPVSKITQTRRV